MLLTTGATVYGGDAAAGGAAGGAGMAAAAPFAIPFLAQYAFNPDYRYNVDNGGSIFNFNPPKQGQNGQMDQSKKNQQNQQGMPGAPGSMMDQGYRAPGPIAGLNAGYAIPTAPVNFQDPYAMQRKGFNF